MAKSESHIFGSHILEIRAGLKFGLSVTLGELNELTARIQKLVAEQFPKGTQVVASLKAEVHAFGN